MEKPLPNQSSKFNSSRNLLRLKFSCLLILFIAGVALQSVAQTPSVSYGSTSSYKVGIPITPLAPTSSNVSAPSYANQAMNSTSSAMNGLAIDAAGNIYIGDHETGLMMLPAGGGPQVSLNPDWLWVNGIALDKYGNLYVSDTGTSSVFRVTNPGQPGSTTTTVVTNEFSQVGGIAFDQQGNLLVGDNSGTGDINKYTLADGVVTSKTTIAQSVFSGVNGITVDAAGNIYVVDGETTVLQKIPASVTKYPIKRANVVTLATNLASPYGVAVDNGGNLFVSERNYYDTSRLLWVDPSGNVTSLNQSSSLNAVTVDGSGNVYYVSGYGDPLFKSTLTGGYYISPALPKGLVFDNTTGIISGTPLVATPATNYTIRAYNNVSNTSAATTVSIEILPDNTVLSGLSVSSGTLTPAFSPATLSYTSTAGAGVGSIKVTPTAADGNTITVNGTAVTSGTASASILTPIGNTVISIVVSGSDGLSKTYTITVNKTGTLEVIYNGGPQTYATGAAVTPLVPVSNQVGAYAHTHASSRLDQSPQFINNPAGVAVTAGGTVYIASYNTATVKKFTPTINGQTSTTGTMVNFGSGYSSPSGVALDANYLYVADVAGNLKKVALNTGVTTTINTGLPQPYAVALDKKGNIFLLDNTLFTVEKITGGIGTAVPFGPAFVAPTGIATDKDGNVYVTDFTAKTVTKLDPNGAVVITYTGFINPEDVELDNGGNIFIGDQQTVKKIAAGTTTPVTLFDNGTGAEYFGIGVDGRGIVYVTDYKLQSTQYFFPKGGYFITPGLPTGLIFDSNTGTISGTPTEATPATNYTVTVYGTTGARSTGIVNIKTTSNNANLSALTISPGSVPVYTSATSTYTANSGADAITVMPAVSDATATVTINGTAVLSGAASASIPLVVGENNIPVIVTASDGTTINSYTLKVTRISGLSNLVVSSGKLSPVFDPLTNNYALTISNLTAAVTITPTTNDAAATLTVNGTTVASGSASASIIIPVGTTSIAVVATAADNTIVTYIVNVTKGPPLSLSYTGGTQAFNVGNEITPLAPTSSNIGDYGTTGYGTNLFNFNNTIPQPYGIATDAAGNVYVTNIGTSSTAALNKITPEGVVTTLAGTYTQPYSVAVDASGNYYVADKTKSLVKNGTVVSGTFNSPVGVTVNIVGDVFVAGGTGTTIRKIPLGTGTATTFTTGFSAANGMATDAEGNVYIAGGAGTKLTKVSANGSVKTVLATGLAGPNGVAIDGSGNIYIADLRKLIMITAADAAAVPAGSSNSPATPKVIIPDMAGIWGVAVDGKNHLYITNTGETPQKTQRLDPVGGYFVSPTLPPGLKFDNATGIISGTPTKTTPATDYTITAFSSVDNISTTVNIKTVSNDATLAGLVTSSGTLSPAFASSTNAYALTVTGSSVTVTPTVNESTATVTVNGTTTASGTASASVPLNMGTNNVPVVVTSGDGTVVNTYTLTITRIPGLNTLAISSGTLSPSFSPMQLTYAASVPNAITGITLTPTVSDASYTVTVNGIAVTSGTASATMPLTTGENTITTVVTAADGTTSTTYTLTVTRLLNQTITFPAFSTSIATGIPDFSPATSSSGLPVTYTFSPSSRASVVNGKIHLLTTGSLIITATQAGNSVYAAATSVQQTVTITKGTPVITFPALAAITFGDADLSPGAVSTNTGTTITHTSSNTAVATILSGKIHIVSAGTANITAAQAAATNYNAAVSVQQTITVNKAPAVAQLTFASLPNMLYGDADFAPGATSANTTLPITYTSSNTSVATIVDGRIHIVGVGSTTITATQAAADANHLTATATQTLTVGAVTPVITFAALPAKAYGDADFAPGATSSNTGSTITYTSSTLAVATIVDGNIHIVGVGTTTITAVQSGSGTYADGTAAQTLIVNAATPVITFAALPANTYGDADFAPGATSDNTAMPITYTSSDHAVATIVDGNIHITGAGTATITASQAASSNYLAGEATQTLTVNAAAQVITFAALPAKTFGDADFAPGATSANTVNPITYISSNLTVATIVDDNIHIIGIGTTIITASQAAADANHAAGTATQTLTVNAATPVITFAALPAKTFGDADFAPGATSNNLTTPIIYTSSDLTVATIVDGNIHIVGAGTAIITASQITDGNYVAGTATQTLTVNAAAPVITFATLPAKTYGDVDFEPGATSTNAAGTISYTISDLTVATIVDGSIHILGAGTTTITATQAAQGNYGDAEAVTQELTITPKTLQLTVDNQSRTYGQANPTLTYSYSTFATGDDESSLAALPVLSTTAEESSMPGDYPITAIGASSPNYTISITNGTLSVLASTDAALSSLSVSNGTLSPLFDPSVITYGVTVSNTTTSIAITPTLNMSSASVKVNGVAVSSGMSSAAITLTVGDNPIPVVVTAQDGTTIKTYTVTVTRSGPPSTMAGLGITLNAGTPLAQTRGPADVNLSSTVAYNVSSIRVKAYVLEAHATIAVNGLPQANNVLSDPIALSVGANIINVIGTAQDGITTRSYRITVTRNAASANIADVSIALNPNITLATTTGSADFNYAASVANTISEITVTPTATSPLATIKVNGVTVATGTATGPITLNPGVNNIDVMGTSQDATVTKTYGISITRAFAGSNIAGLGVTLNVGTPLVQTAGPANVNLSSTVAYNVSSIRVKAYVLEPHATIKINGAAQANNVLSDPIALGIGDNIINVVGTAQDGITTRTYRITVTRTAPPTNIADLSLALNPSISLTSVNGSADFNYAARVANAVSNLVITPTATSPSATIKVNGITVANGTASSPIALNTGSNTIDVVGTSQDGTVTKSYRIAIIRGMPGSSMAGLGITLSAGTPLVQVSGPSDVNFTSTVANGISSISVKAYVLEPNATITLNGSPLPSNVLSAPIALTVGQNVIDVVGAAQDAITTRSYRITVTRSMPAVNVADVMFALNPVTTLIQVSSGSADVNYTAAVANNVTQVSVLPTAASTTATILVNGIAVTTGTASDPIILNPGANNIDIVGTSQDNSVSKSYRIIVTRAQPGSNVAGLGITLSEGTKLVQVKGPADVNVNSTVANNVTSVRVKAYVLEPNATINLNGAPQVSNVYSDPIALNVGDNIIEVVGTAQDRATKRTYRVTVTRSPQTLFAFNSHEPGKFSDVKETRNIVNSNDGVVVHQGVSPNGDGMNDFLTIEGISAYKDNKLSIMNANGALVFETKNYGSNGTNLFDGHSNKNGSLLKPGTYFYSLEYQVDKESKRKTGFVILKY